jgi:hypothetical protein
MLGKNDKRYNLSYKNHMKTLITLLSLFVFNFVYACPGCAGSMDNPKDGMMVWILCGFIALTYIPFYLLYKTIIKNRHLNEHNINQTKIDEK